MAEQPAVNPIVIWLLIFSSVALVAGITYVYTNRNRRLTISLTLLALLSIGLIRLFSIIHIKLTTHFLGGYNENNLLYVAANPGWSLLIDGWYIWAIPVLLTVIIIISLCYAFYHPHQLPQIKALSNDKNLSTQRVPTRAERLNTFMAIDGAKKEAQRSNEKLAEALLMNTAYEIKVSDLNMRVDELEKELAETKNRFDEENTTLQLELSAKTKENEYIAQQLTERNRELRRAQEMFEKLLALQQKTKK